MTIDELREKASEAAKWPAATRSPEEKQIVLELRSALSRRMFRIVEFAEQWDRDLTADEQSEHDALKAEFDALG